MKVFVVNTDDMEERCFSTLRNALRFGDDVRTMNLDIDSLPKEGCTLADIEWWSDDIDLWLLD